MKHTASNNTLVNFLVPKTALEPFDHACALAGKTRTQVLTEMMNDHVRTIGAKLPEAIRESDRINQKLKNAAMNARNLKSADRTEPEPVGPEKRVKRRFSSFTAQRYIFPKTGLR